MQAGKERQRGRFVRLSGLLGSPLWPRGEPLALSLLWDLLPDNRLTPLDDAGKSRRTPLHLVHEALDPDPHPLVSVPVAYLGAGNGPLARGCVRPGRPTAGYGGERVEGRSYFCCPWRNRSALFSSSRASVSYLSASCRSTTAVWGQLSANLAALGAVSVCQLALLLASVLGVASRDSPAVVQPDSEVPLDPFALQLFKQVPNRLAGPRLVVIRWGAGEDLADERLGDFPPSGRSCAVPGPG